MSNPVVQKLPPLSIDSSNVKPPMPTIVSRTQSPTVAQVRSPHSSASITVLSPNSKEASRPQSAYDRALKKMDEQVGIAVPAMGERSNSRGLTENVKQYETLVEQKDAAWNAGNYGTWISKLISLLVAYFSLDTNEKKDVKVFEKLEGFRDAIGGLSSEIIATAKKHSKDVLSFSQNLGSELGKVNIHVREQLAKDPNIKCNDILRIYCRQEIMGLAFRQVCRVAVEKLIQEGKITTKQDLSDFLENVNSNSSINGGDPLGHHIPALNEELGVNIKEATISQQIQEPLPAEGPAQQSELEMAIQETVRHTPATQPPRRQLSDEEVALTRNRRETDFHSANYEYRVAKKELDFWSSVRARQEQNVRYWIDQLRNARSRSDIGQINIAYENVQMYGDEFEKAERYESEALKAFKAADDAVNTAWSKLLDPIV